MCHVIKFENGWLTHVLLPEMPVCFVFVFFYVATFYLTVLFAECLKCNNLPSIILEQSIIILGISRWELEIGQSTV